MGPGVTHPLPETRPEKLTTLRGRTSRPLVALFLGAGASARVAAAGGAQGTAEGGRTIVVDIEASA